MITVSITEAKARFKKYVDLAESGENVCITRRGKIVARIVAAEAPRQPIDFEMLRKLREKLPMQTENSGDFIRRMRDDDRY